MPYIRKSLAEAIQNNLQLVKKPGELNYVYTCLYVECWKVSPCYDTFHEISKTVDDPNAIASVANATGVLACFHKPLDLKVARREAVAEFRRRVITSYEHTKSSDPENVDPYLFFTQQLTGVKPTGFVSSLQDRLSLTTEDSTSVEDDNGTV
jgi:hypothetical protein